MTIHIGVADEEHPMRIPLVALEALELEDADAGVTVTVDPARAVFLLDNGLARYLRLSWHQLIALGAIPGEVD